MNTLLMVFKQQYSTDTWTSCTKALIHTIIIFNSIMYVHNFLDKHFEKWKLVPSDFHNQCELAQDLDYIVWKYSSKKATDLG